MTNKEKISIIITVANGAGYVKKTLPALLGLDYPDFEIIIADNGLNTDLPEYLEKNGYDKVIYLRSKPFSKTVASNRGASEAKGKFLLFLDADALVSDKNILSKINSLLTLKGQTCFSIGFMNTNKSYIGKGGRLFIPSRFLRELFRIKNDNLRLDYPQGFAFFITKTVWDKIGGYDEKISFGCEEMDIGFKLRTIKASCQLCDDISITDIGIPQGEIDLKKNMNSEVDKYGKMIYGKVFFINKHYSLFDKVIILPLLFLKHLMSASFKSFNYKNSGFLKAVLAAYFRKDE